MPVSIPQPARLRPLPGRGLSPAPAVRWFAALLCAGMLAFPAAEAQTAAEADSALPDEVTDAGPVALSAYVFGRPPGVRVTGPYSEHSLHGVTLNQTVSEATRQAEAEGFRCAPQPFALECQRRDETGSRTLAGQAVFDTADGEVRLFFVSLTVNQDTDLGSGFLDRLIERFGMPKRPTMDAIRRAAGNISTAFLDGGSPIEGVHFWYHGETDLTHAAHALWDRNLGNSLFRTGLGRFRENCLPEVMRQLDPNLDCVLAFYRTFVVAGYASLTPGIRAWSDRRRYQITLVHPVEYFKVHTLDPMMRDLERRYEAAFAAAKRDREANERPLDF